MNNTKYEKVASESSSILNEKEYQILNLSAENSLKSSLIEGKGMLSLLNKKKREVELDNIYKHEKPRESTTKAVLDRSYHSSSSDEENKVAVSSEIVLKAKRDPGEALPKIVIRKASSNTSCENILNMSQNSKLGTSKNLISDLSDRNQENKSSDKKVINLVRNSESQDLYNNSFSKTESSLQEDSPRKDLDSKSIVIRRNAIMNDDVMKTLKMKEQDKRKSSKRRANLFNRKSTNEEQLADYNPASMTALIKKVESGTSYGRNKQYIKYIDCIIAMLVCLNIVISIVDNELYLSHADTYFQNYTTFYNITNINITVMAVIQNREITPFENTLRFINVANVLTNIVFINLHYYFKIKLLQDERKLSEHDNIFSSGLYKHLFIEILSCAFFMPPYLNYVFTGEMMDLIFCYNLNAIISFFVLLKCYIILRVYAYFSRWTSDMANSICMKYKVRTGIHFAIKAELKKRPYTMLLTLMLVVLTLCSIAVRTFEYSLKVPDAPVAQKSNLQPISDCFWLIIMTMTTVGYGDFVPRSHFGRCVTVVACIVGMLLVSLIVVSLAVVAEFTSEEKKAYLIIKKLQAEDIANNKAVEVIKLFMKLRVLSVKKDSGLKLVLKNRTFFQLKGIQNITSINARFIILTQLKRSISDFKSDFRIANSYSLPIDEMLKRLETKFKCDINQLSINIYKIAMVDGHLDTLATVQNLVQKKMSVILKRQREVANYMVKVNNENYKNLLTKMMEGSRKNSTISETIIKNKQNSTKKIDNMELKNENNLNFDKISEDHSSFNIYSNNNDSSRIENDIEGEDNQILEPNRINQETKSIVDEVYTQPKINLNSIYFDNQENLN